MIIYEVYYGDSEQNIMRDVWAHSAEDAIALLAAKYPQYPVFFVYDRTYDLIFTPNDGVESSRTDAHRPAGTPRVNPVHPPSNPKGEAIRKLKESKKKKPKPKP